MTLNINKTENLSHSELIDFENWREGFSYRAQSSEQAEINFGRALKRKFGYSDYRITGSNNLYCLNLGQSR